MEKVVITTVEFVNNKPTGVMYPVVRKSQKDAKSYIMEKYDSEKWMDRTYTEKSDGMIFILLQHKVNKTRFRRVYIYPATSDRGPAIMDDLNLMPI